MRVLMTADVRPDSGGVSHHIASLVNELAYLGVEVDVLWKREAPAFWERGPLGVIGHSLSAANTTRRRTFDIVHAHGAAGALLSRSLPIVVTSHGDELAAYRVQRAYEHVPWRSRLSVTLLRMPLFDASIHRANSVIALTDYDAERFRKMRKNRDVHVIPNGVDPPMVLPPLRIDGNPVIAYMGTWIPRKGVGWLPEALRRIRAADPRVRMLLIGPDRGALEAFNVEDRPFVSISGFIDHKTAVTLVAQADLLIFPSLYEGMPLAVLEAMSVGTPPVGFAIPSMKATVNNAGVLVREGSALELAAACTRLLADPPRLRKLQVAAMEEAASRTWANAAQDTLDTYEATMKRWSVKSKL